VSPPAPQLCMVTADSTSTNNIIYWDKTLYASADSFIVYREVSTNVYSRIGAVYKSALSEFTDANRAVGPANGDPSAGSYRYKMQIRDTCGNYSILGPYHNSVWFNDQHTGAFSWNTYDVEGAANTPVSNFYLMRDSVNTGNWRAIASVAGTQTTLNDSQYSTYVSTANWRVEASGFNCSATLRTGNIVPLTTINKSRSNVRNNRTVGINLLSSVGQVTVYPNPNKGVFDIQVGDFENVNVEIYNLLGEKIYAGMLQSANTQVDLTGFANGMYQLKLQKNNVIVYRTRISKTE
jgi:hypothetical protein